MVALMVFEGGFGGFLWVWGCFLTQKFSHHFQFVGVVLHFLLYTPHRWWLRFFGGCGRVILFDFVFCLCCFEVSVVEFSPIICGCFF